MEHNFERCPNTTHIEDMLRRIDNLEKTQGALMDKVQALETGVAVSEKDIKLAVDLSYSIKSDLKDLRVEIKELYNRPADRWNALTLAGIGGSVTLLLGYLANKILG